MRAQIGRWGNGLALRIPKHLADALAIGEGTAVAIGMEGGRLVLMPCASAPTPEDLPARITPASLPDEGADEAPVGLASTGSANWWRHEDLL
jgi:antitoxin component of MazEF toxin-antitoxin module